MFLPRFPDPDRDRDVARTLPRREGRYIEEYIEQLIDRDPGFIAWFSAVVVADLPSEPVLRKAAELLWKNRIPLLLCASYGFIGQCGFAHKPCVRFVQIAISVVVLQIWA